MKGMLEGIMIKYKVLEKENKELLSKFKEYEYVIEANKEIKKELVSIKRENEILKAKLSVMRYNLKI